MAKKKAKKKEEPKPEKTDAAPKEEKPKEKPKKEKKSVVKEFAGDWYDKLMGKAGDEFKELPENIQPIAADALRYMAENKDQFIDMGEEALKEMFNFLGGGEKTKARDLFIRTKLGPDGLIAFVKNNNEAMQKSIERRASLEGQFNAFLKTVGNFALNLLKTLMFG